MDALPGAEVLLLVPDLHQPFLQPYDRPRDGVRALGALPLDQQEGWVPNREVELNRLGGEGRHLVAQTEDVLPGGGGLEHGPTLALPLHDPKIGVIGAVDDHVEVEGPTGGDLKGEEHAVSGLRDVLIGAMLGVGVDLQCQSRPDPEGGGMKGEAQGHQQRHPTTASHSMRSKKNHPTMLQLLWYQ